jgi:hypothetical protein
VWIHLQKERIPHDRESKLKPRGDGPFNVLKRINDNAYVIDIPMSKYLVSNTFNVKNQFPFHGDVKEEESRATLSQGGGDDAAHPSDAPTLTPTSSPTGPLTRSRAKAIHDKLNSLLSTCDFDTILDRLLLHANTLCTIRCQPQELPSSDNIEPTTREKGKGTSSSPSEDRYYRPDQAGTIVHYKTGTSRLVPKSLSGSDENLQYTHHPSPTLGLEVDQHYRLEVWAVLPHLDRRTSAL